MPFPQQDTLWMETALFIKKYAGQEMRLLAPDEFIELFPNVYCYEAPSLDASLKFEWVIIHKGLFDRIPKAFLDQLLVEKTPVFANEVFVVFTQDKTIPTLDRENIHLKAFLELKEIASTCSPNNSRPNARLQPLHFATLDVEGVRQAMNERYAQSGNDEYAGYEHPNHWDKVRFHEVDRLIKKMTGLVLGLDVLEIGCGMGRNAPLFVDARSYLGTDLSDLAISKAKTLYRETTSHRFARMNAMDLELENASVDFVLGVEWIEHVQDTDKMLSEIGRVLKLGGIFLFDSANRDSLHQRILRQLGHPEILSTHEHFREFGYLEMKDLLAQHSFEIVQAEGVFLHPYLNLPGMPVAIKDLALNDPKTVEILRTLGEKAGPEYGFEFMILARKH